MNFQRSTRLTFDRPGRGRVYDSILETIGNTPLVRIGRLAHEMECQAEVLAKLEYFSPAASVKDRIAVAMLEAMDAGCVPIVYDMKSGIPEVVRSGKNGLIVPHGDVAAVVEGGDSDIEQMKKSLKAGEANLTGNFNASKLDSDGLVAAVRATLPKQQGLTGGGNGDQASRT